MPKPERQQQVLDLLKGLRGIEPLKQLFWSELNYQRVNEPLSRRGWTDSAAQVLAEDPVLFAGGGENNDFHVIYGRLASDRLLLGNERPVVSRLVKEHPYALFLFSNKAQDRWHFLNVKYDKAVERRQLFRRITVVPGDGLRTAGERIALLNLEEIGADRSPLTIQEQHDAAFDVEKVTKDFYAEIANWYFWACEHVVFPVPPGTKDLNAYKAQSLIRLITRLIFCWFVKEKGLIPGELFDSRSLAKLLKAGAELPASEDTTYYKAILQNLFFATLNQEMGQRAFRKRHKDKHGRDPHRGITNLYRYQDAFADADAFLRLMEGIPFLNGGLFECLDKVYRAEEKLPEVRIDGFSDHPKNPLSVPDFLFFGDERAVDLSAAYGEKRYRQATVRGLIQTFDRYKFTITENTPLDQEVALDPELSGKVFENLLAAYNPETATTARKQTGSFYTPREIVDYMVDEALMAYLETKLNHGDTETQRRLRHLFAYNEEPHQFSPAEVKTLIAAIDSLKALDPACGSGAFPMGLLHKLVFILGKLDPHNEQWKQKQIAKASELTDATIREKTLADIEQAFAANELDYGRKLYLIENCIYGVDIQPIAVQIAKMRFFISLIVDQKVDPQTDNLGIRPLPNLETKFVAANTLIGIEKPAQQMLRNPQIDAKEAELRQVRERHFTARTPATKARCREQDAKLRAEIGELLRADGFPRETTEKLAHWNPYDQNASADFFDPEWMFGLATGFHIVTGNPPYVRIQTLTATEPAAVEYFKSRYASASKGNYDLYVVFVERSLELLQPAGQLAYILPHKFFNAQYGQPLRELLAQGRHLRHVVHFGDQQIFPGATNYVCLLFLAKAGADGCRWVRADDLADWLATLHAPETTLPAARITAAEWNFAGSTTDALLDKLRRSGTRLLDLPADMSRGHSTGDDEVFVLEANSNHVEKEILRVPVFATDFNRYSYTPNSHWRVIFPYREQGGSVSLLSEVELRRAFPKAFRYLATHRKKLEQRKGARCWFGFTAPRNLDLHDKCQILVPLLAEKGSFALVPRSLLGKLCPMASGGFTISAASCPYRIEYLLALLNSHLLFWMMLRTSNLFRGGWITCTKQYFGELPIRPVNFADVAERAEHDAVVKLVERILAAKRADPSADTAALEREIDERVYRLYGLTKEEIKIVEESGKR